MGYKLGIEIANADMPIEDRLSWHLSANHYPPIDSAFIPVAKDAIFMACNENWDTPITFPNGIVHTVAWVVEYMHLEPFIPTMNVPND